MLFKNKLTRITNVVLFVLFLVGLISPAANAESKVKVFVTNNAEFQKFFAPTQGGVNGFDTGHDLSFQATELLSNVVYGQFKQLSYFSQF